MYAVARFVTTRFDIGLRTIPPVGISAGRGDTIDQEQSRVGKHRKGNQSARHDRVRARVWVWGSSTHTPHIQYARTLPLIPTPLTTAHTRVYVEQQHTPQQLRDLQREFVQAFLDACPEKGGYNVRASIAKVRQKY